MSCDLRLLHSTVVIGLFFLDFYLTVVNLNSNLCFNQQDSLCF